MQTLIVQLQFLLTALGALLPLVPAQNREKLSELLRMAADALRLGDAVAEEARDVAMKLRAIRLDVEALALNGESIDADKIDHAFERVRAASHALRAALEAAQASRA